MLIMRRLRNIIFLLLFSSSLIAQSFRANVKHFSEKDGLSHNETHAIVKDERGIIWVATKSGLNRFDGKQFKIFTTTQGLHSDNINALKQEGKYLWLFYEHISIDKQLVTHIDILDTYSGKVTALPNFMALKMPFAWQNVVNCERVNENIIFQLADNQRYIYQFEKGFEKLNNIATDEQVIASTYQKYIWKAKYLNDSIFVTQQTFEGQIVGKCAFWGNKNSRIKLLYENANMRYWLWSKKYDDLTSIHFFETTQNFNIIKKINLYLVEKLYVDFFRARYIENLDAIWIAEYDKAVLIDKTGKTLLSIRDSMFKKLITSHRCLVEGKTIWQASSEGFYKIDIQTDYFTTILTHATGFRAITKTANRLFVNSDAGVLSSANLQKAILPNGLSSFVDKNNDLWVSNNNRLFHFKPNNNTFTEYQVPVADPWTLHADTAGNIFLSEGGLVYFNPQTRLTQPIQYGEHEALKSSIVYYFYSLSPNIRLLCTTSGLYEFDINTKQILARYWSGGKGKYYLPTNDFRHLYFDPSTQLYWLATGQHGLMRWNKQIGEVKYFTFNDNLTNILHAVYADNYGFLWCSTDKGIVQFDKNTAQFRVYTTKDGLFTNEFNRISHFQDQDGTLYFGGIKGLTFFHPKYLKDELKKIQYPRLFVMELQQYLGSSNSLENMTPQYLMYQRITLKPNDRYFIVTLGLDNYEYSDKTIYYYQIKHHDQDWTKAESNQIIFGRLPYGKQIILVKTLLDNGLYSDHVLEIEVDVIRPFYLRWWFFVLIALLISIGIFIRFNALRLRNVRLEQEVVRRTEKIEQQAAELRELDQMKSRFFANISHELRTPLTLIASPLQRLMREEQNPERKQFLHFAAKNSQRLLRLVNEILDLTKLEASKLTLEFEKIQVLHFSKRILAEFDSFAVHKGVQLNITTDLREDVIAIFDIKKVETILYNLISNALKFTTEGGRVSLQVREIAQGIAFEVSDTGRGIASEDLPYIFDRFYQSQTHKTAEGGTGIGLALCKELCNLMEGAINVQSDVGKGTTFTFKLPCEVSRTEGVVNEHIELLSAVTDSHFDKDDTLPHLLLVEDNEDLQRYIRVLLQQEYHIKIVNNGKIALDYLKKCLPQHLPSLIVSDIMMPEMDGFQLLKQLKSTPTYHQIPVIMLTARTGNDDKLTALRIGVDDYLTKPFLEEELKARIQNLINRANLREQFKNLVLEAEDETQHIENETIENEVAETLPNHEWLAALEQYILQHLTDPTFSVASAAEAFEMSRFKFTRAVSLAVGMTALDYIQEIRLNEARRLLHLDPDMPIKQVAAAVGFANPKLFSRKFQQRFGVYPSQV